MINKGDDGPADRAYHASKTDAQTPAALDALIYEAVRFADWAAGQGVAPIDGENAGDPSEFVMAYCCAVDDCDGGNLAEKVRDAISALRAEVETLTAERDEALPWKWFYGDGLNLGEIAERTGKSIYAYSPWLTAPVTRTVLECTESSRAKIEAAEARALASDTARASAETDRDQWREAHTREYQARIATEMEQSAAESARASAETALAEARAALLAIAEGCSFPENDVQRACRDRARAALEQKP